MGNKKMATSKTSIKKRKKSWYGIYAPECLKKQQLGESIVYTSNDLIGKSLKLNLSMFTNDMRKQNVDVKFSVKTVVDSKAITAITGIELTAAYTKRLVRRGRNKVDDSFLLVSKDKQLIRIKPFIITNARTERSVTSRLRLELRKLLSKNVASTSAEDFFMNLINQKIQKELRDTLSKIYPLKFVDVRQAYIAKKSTSGLIIEATEDVQKEKLVVDESLEEESETDEELVEEKKKPKKKVSKPKTEKNTESDDSEETDEAEDEPEEE